MGLSIRLIDLQLQNVPGSRLRADIRSGERIGLAGANGAGKSSLLRYLACLKRPEAMGQLLLDGKDPFHAHDLEKLRGQMGCLLQEPERSMVFSRIDWDAAFGPENLATPPEVIRKRWKGLSEKLLYGRKEVPAGYEEVKDDTGSTADGEEQIRIKRAVVKTGSLADSEFRELSGGQKQRAALTSALMMRAPLLLLDEPFSMLSEAEAEEILSFLLGMTKRLSQTMVVVSNDPRVLRRMDRVLLLEEGRLKELNYREDGWYSPTEDVIYELSGKPTADSVQEAEGLRLDRVEGIDTVEVYSPILSCEDLSFRYGKDQVIRHFSAVIYPGIYYELSGGTGSGKTTLCKLLNGTLIPNTGHISLKGKPVHTMTVSGMKRWLKGDGGQGSELRKAVGFVMQFPEDQLFADTVIKDVMYGVLKSGKEKAEARKDAEDALEILGVSRKLWEKAPEKLSGGEKRRVAIAGVLAMKPEIFILDEPYAGLDREGTELLREVLREYVRQGRTVIVTTH